MKKKDYMVLILVVLLGFAFPLSAFLIQNNRENFIMARTPENGNWSVRELNVKLGSQLQITVVSDDVTHSFKIEDYNIDVLLYPGKAVDITINADIAGEFVFKCFVYCSPSHKNMTGKLIVSV